MDKIVVVIKNLVPFIMQYPKWIQVFFVAIVFQIFLLLFILFFQHIFILNKENKSKSRDIKIRTELQKDEIIEQADINTIKIIDDDLKKTLASGDPRVAATLSNLACMYKAQGKYKKAIELSIGVASIYERAYGQHHPQYATALNDLGTLYLETADYKKAESNFLQALSILAKLLGSNHSDNILLLNNLAKVYLKLAEYDKAAPIIEHSIQIREAALEHPSSDLIPSYSNLLEIYKKTDNIEKVKEIERKLLVLEK